AREVELRGALERVKHLLGRSDIGDLVRAVGADTIGGSLHIEADEKIVHVALDGVHWAVVPEEAQDGEHHNQDNCDDGDGAPAITATGRGNGGRGSWRGVAWLLRILSWILHESLIPFDLKTCPTHVAGRHHYTGFRLRVWSPPAQRLLPRRHPMPKSKG